MDKKYDAVLATLAAVKAKQAENQSSFQLSRSECFGCVAALIDDGFTVVTELKDSRYASSAILRLEKPRPGMAAPLAVNVGKRFGVWTEQAFPPGYMKSLIANLTKEQLAVGAAIADAGGY